MNWVDNIINTLQTGRKSDYFAHLETLPERPALNGTLDRALSEEPQRVLEAKGLSRLYSHQAEAINHLAGGGERHRVDVDGQREVPVLLPASTCDNPGEAQLDGPLHVPDKGAGARPARLTRLARAPGSADRLQRLRR